MSKWLKRLMCSVFLLHVKSVAVVLASGSRQRNNKIMVMKWRTSALLASTWSTPGRDWRDFQPYGHVCGSEVVIAFVLVVVPWRWETGAGQSQAIECQDPALRQG